jgi:ATP-binding cassette subfamily F protein 3
MTLAETKGGLETTRCAPEIHRNPEQLKTLRQELHAVSRNLEQSYRDWEELSSKMEALEHEAGESPAPPPA